MELFPSWEAASRLDTKTFHNTSWNPEGSLSCSQEPSAAFGLDRFLCRCHVRFHIIQFPALNEGIGQIFRKS
jgi:hypothetical protein